jgi:hypothetical protein
MFVALYLLYRIACPKQVDTQKDDTSPEESKQKKNIADVMGKSRFVLPERSKPLQTPATSLATEKQDEKEDMFAAETAEKPSRLIPESELDELFYGEPDPETLTIPPDETDEDEIDYEAEEEAENLNRTLGHIAAMAEGVDYDKLQAAVKVVKEQPGEVSEETAGTIAELENTDVFEQLVSGDDGKADWIKAVVERHLLNTMPETENETSGMDYDSGNFDAAYYFE